MWNLIFMNLLAFPNSIKFQESTLMRNKLCFLFTSVHLEKKDISFFVHCLNMMLSKFLCFFVFPVSSTPGYFRSTQAREENNASGENMKSLRQLPFSKALRRSQPSTQPTCPQRAVNSPNIQFNLYFAKQLWHICTQNEIQELQTVRSLKLHHSPHFILFINGQAIYGCSVKFKEGAVHLAFTSGQAAAHRNKQ